jgi:hypothetical protein
MTALELASMYAAAQFNLAPQIGDTKTLALEVLSLHAECERMRAVCEAAKAYDSATGGMGWSDGHYSGCGQSSERPCSACDMRDALDASAKEK